MQRELWLCCGLRISDDGSDLLSFSSSAKLSHNYELGIDFHNLATITQYYSIFSFNGNHIGRESWERWGSGSCNIFSACHWNVQSWTRKQNKTEMSSFLPHPLLSNLSLHSCHLLCNFSSEVLKLKIYNSIYRNLFHLEIYTQYPIWNCDHWAFKDNSIKS